MEEKKKTLLNWLKTYWIYILIYALFLFISITSPRSGDDWEISQWYKSGFVSTCFAMVRAFTYLNGRIANNIFDSFFSYYDFIWKIVSPLIFTSIIFLSGKLFNYHKKVFPIAVNFLILLSVSNNIRKETYVWLIGNVSYIFVIPFILLYFNILFDRLGPSRLVPFKSSAIKVILVGFLAFFIGVWIENTTLGFLAANLLILLYWLVIHKKPSIYIYSGLVGSFLSCLVLFSTPKRADTLGVSVSGLFHRVLHNYSGVINDVVVQNSVVFLIFIIIFLLFIYSKRKSIHFNFIVIISTIYAFSTATIILIRQILILLTENWYVNAIHALNRINSLFFTVSKPIPLIFCSLMIGFVFLVLLFVNQKEKALAIFFLSLASAGAMLVSPYLGARTFSLSIIMLGAIVAYLSSEIESGPEDVWKVLKVVLILLTISQMERHIYWGWYTYRIENIRLQAIEAYRSGLHNGTIDESDWLILPAISTDAVRACTNPGPYDFHMQPFKEYHNLPDTANVVFDDGFGVKTFEVKQVDGLFYKLEVTPLFDISDYSYVFYVESTSGVVYQSNILEENYDFFEFPEPGIYSISCKLQNDYGEETTQLPQVEIN